MIQIELYYYMMLHEKRREDLKENALDGFEGIQTWPHLHKELWAAHTHPEAQVPRLQAQAPVAPGPVATWHAWPRNLINLHWNSMKNFKSLLKSYSEFHWISLNFIEFHWISLDFIDVHWISLNRRDSSKFQASRCSSSTRGSLGLRSWTLQLASMKRCALKVS